MTAVVPTMVKTVVLIRDRTCDTATPTTNNKTEQETRLAPSSVLFPLDRLDYVLTSYDIE